MTRSRTMRLLLPALAAAAFHVPAAAQCSRPIVVPAAPTGKSVIFTDGVASGLMPEMMAHVGERAGCTFRWSAVPRMRLEAMFEAGTADLLVAATEVERRSRHGIFVPVLYSRPSLISIELQRAPLRSLADLLARRELRVALVRGFDYGSQYQAMINALTAQGRVYFESNPASVARLLAGSMADVTIMPVGVFTSSLYGDARTEAITGKLRTEHIEELPWIKSGIYISRKSLSKQDQQVLEKAITASVKTGAWWQAFRRYYPPAVLDMHARPLDAHR